MKTLLIASLTIAIAYAINVYDVVLDEWNSYKANFRRHFRSSEEEYGRLQHFLKSKDLVARHNLRYAKGLESYRLSLNRFADRPPFAHVDVKTATLRYMEERARVREESAGSNITIPPDAVIPDAVDWTKRGAVEKEAMDQGNCGSCYAVSAAGIMDALMYIKHNKKVHLSPQQIVDCSKSFGNYGCDGGTFGSTFRYLMTTGLVPFDDYPYEDKVNDHCKIKGDDYFSQKVKQYYFMFDGDEEKLKYAVATYGPLAIGMDARPGTFHFYSGGIYDDSACGDILVHAVLLVGYGTDPKTQQDYWLIKNSWGSSWGEDGFIRVARHKHLCGIGTLVYGATLE